MRKLTERQILRITPPAPGTVVTLKNLGDVLNAAVAIGVEEELVLLEAKLLELRSNTVGITSYMRGRLDVIGEFQDIILERKKI